jgi:NAD(P)-dependent dehydrogenase (short-subunit alcohol dehydrogenase family)
MSDRMQGKVALISGGARGQGAAMAALFAREGANVVIGDILDEAGKETAALLAAQGAGDVRYTHLDVTSSSGWNAAVEFAESSFGKLDVLINNAGIVTYSPVVECSDQEWDKVIAVDQTGVFYGMRAAIPALRRAGGGAIVNTSSVYGGVRGPNECVAYGAAKAAVVAMTKSAAQIYGPENIRVNVIAPGIVESPMLEQDTAAFGQEAIVEMVKAIPLRRSCTADEIAKSVLFLVTDDSSHVTGHTLVIDGAMSV